MVMPEKVASSRERSPLRPFPLGPLLGGLKQKKNTNWYLVVSVQQSVDVIVR